MVLNRQAFIVISLLVLSTEAVFAHPGNNASTAAICKKTGAALANHLSVGSTDFALESEKALKVQRRRNQIRILPDGKLVRFNHRSDNNKVLILGGAEAFPM